MGGRLEVEFMQENHIGEYLCDHYESDWFSV